MHPMKTPIWIPAAAALLALSAHAAGAQSLGAVAEKEEARRKRIGTPGKVYTNGDLSGGRDAASSQPAPPAAATTPKPAEPPKPDAETERKNSEAQWRGRMAKAREGLERARTFKEALQSRINALTADFAARDDPAQRSVVSSDRQKAIAELERVSKEIADFEKEIRDIEEEARKAGVPPGWLR